MAFLLHTLDTADAPPLVELDAKSGTAYTIGLALTLTGGQAVAAAGTVKPSYICMTDKTAAEGDKVQAVRVLASQVYDATLSTAGASLKPGAKVTLSADGTQVTATTEGGVAEIISMDGAASGDVVRVRF